MGHIERRVWSGKASYRARYRDPAGRERSKSFSRKADAERWLAEVEHTKTRGMWTDPRPRPYPLRGLARRLVVDNDEPATDHASS